MFTGIVAAVGAIREVDALGDDGLRLTVAAGGLDMSDVALGDSIAIQGACMTVVSRTADSFVVEVSAESLRRTVGLARPGAVNLEKAMRLSDRVGGHLVSGHVDGLGVVRRFEQVGESHLLEILAPQAMAPFVAVKGSITVDGVSLTVNQVQDLSLSAALADAAWSAEARHTLAGDQDRAPTETAGIVAPDLPCCAFQINLIPHTLAQTTLKRLQPGLAVNLEIDLVARYLARMQAVAARHDSTQN
ncbi:MAG: riboflavin synthase [Lautropia sp.]|nr:riboflavin synthase [Lautropia sp.]